MLTISSVILPAPVASAASSNGLILSKYASTASALSLSTPKSNNAAPNVAAPSKILNVFMIPDGIAAARPRHKDPFGLHCLSLA